MLTTMGYIIAGAAFPPLLALRHRTTRLFWIFSFLQFALIVVFFTMYWGPAMIAHAGIWLLGIVTLLPRRVAHGLERLIGGQV